MPSWELLLLPLPYLCFAPAGMGLALAQEYGKLSAAEPESFRYIDAKVAQADSEIGQNDASSVRP
jgi:hypothetical protein